MYTLAPLPYAPEALEPHLDAATMGLHHDKHHQTYVDKLNAALADHADVAALPIEDVLWRFDEVVAPLPEAVRGAVRNHGGGHANHSLFWNILSAEGVREPVGTLATALQEAFGDFASFKTQFIDVATKHFGSGWAWLVVDEAGKLAIYATLNQDSPLMKQHQPLLGIDVWEHAYYLKYQNRRPEYLEAIWNVLDWNKIEERFVAAKR